MKKLITILLLFSSFNIYAQQAGNALDFDGTNDYVEVPDNSSLDLTTNYTIEAWIKPESFAWLGGIVGKYHTPGSNGYLLRLHSVDPFTGLCFDEMYTSAGILEADTWYHIAAVNDNGTRKLYLNGVEQTLTGTPLTVQANSDPLCIGVDYLSSARYFDGKIEEVRIWNTTRNSVQIRENMYLPLSGTETGLVSYWQFNDGTGTTLSDIVGGNSGTLTNMDENDWITSTIPFGAGQSNTQTETAGTVDFTNTGLSMFYNSQNGAEVTVTRIDTTPNIGPSGLETVFDTQYWVVNRFGTGSFDADLTFILNEDLTSEDEFNPFLISLYTRGSNADTSWGYLASASSVDAATDEATFEGITEFSQFIIGKTAEPKINLLKSLDFTLITTNFNSIDVGNIAAPNFTDIDGDGLLDLIIGEMGGNLNHYEQDAANSTSFSLITENFNSIDIGSYSAPTFTDLDGDGLLDLIIGVGGGNLNHYEQDAVNSTLFLFITENFNSIDVGAHSIPDFTDLDGDGLLDLIIGEMGGNLNHYEQDAANSTSFSLVTDYFNTIYVGSRSVPTFTDVDGDGLLDLIIGENNANLNHYEQNVINSTSFSLVTENFIYTGINSAPSFTDLDGDELPDLIIGENAGNLYHYEQKGIDTLSFGNVLEGNYAYKNYYLKAVNIISDLNIECPEGYKVSLSEFAGFHQNLSITPVNQSIFDTIYLRFEPDSLKEYSGNILHSSNGAETKNIAVIGIGVESTDAFPGTALDFDGINDYVEMAGNYSLDLTDSLTIEAWIKADSWKANVWEGGIVAKDGDFSGYMIRCGDNGKVNFNIGTGAWNEITTDEADSLYLNTWYHIAVTYDGASQKIYINGVLVKEKPTSGDVVANSNPLMIGTSSRFLDRAFAGKIEEVRIWNTARDSVQIRENMYLHLSGAETGLVSYWQFNDGTGTTLSDVAGGNRGTLSNMDEEDWVTSTIPFGSGQSNTKTETVGTVDFTYTSLSMYYNSQNDAEVTVTRIDTVPNIIRPSGSVFGFDEQYWVVDRFGTGSFDADLTFTLTEDLELSDQNNPSNIKLYTRGSNADTGWDYLTSASSVDATTDEATFEGITEFGQFIIGKITDAEINLLKSPDFTLITTNFNSIDVGYYSTPSLTDLDGDSLLDLIIGEDDGTLKYYEQDSVNSTSFSFITGNFNSIDVGYSSVPAFTDIDGDGLLDLIIGKDYGTLNHYEQDTINSISFSLITENFNSIGVGLFSAPSFTDLDGDGLLDLIIGEYIGTLNHYEQDTVNSTSFSFITGNFNSITVGSRSKPTFTDLDGNGLLDLIIGEIDGNLNHYEQDTANSTLFPVVTGNLSSIYIGNSSVPAFTDLDDDGLLDLIIGEIDGNLNHYEQEGIDTLSFENVLVGNNVYKNYYLIAGNIVSNLNIECPEGFKVSLSESAGFLQSLLITPVNQRVSDKIYLRFEPDSTKEYNGNIVHSSEEAETKNITVSGAGVESTDTFPGTALDFNGTDDYIEVPYNYPLDLTNSLTIEAWIKAGSWKTNVWEGDIVAKEGNFSGYMLCCGNNGKVNFNIRTDAWNELTTDEQDSLSLNTWYHIAATYDGTTQKIYINGLLAKEKSTSGDVVANSISLMIGTSPRFLNRTFAGKIDEVRIWNVARDSVQIRENMHLTLEGTETGLVTYWQFNDGTGTTLSDVAGGNRGTLTNMDEEDWVTSTIPFGVGQSNTKTETAGSVDFTNTGLSMYYNSQNGAEVTVTRIDTVPNIGPPEPETVFDAQYWVVNRFGTGSFDADLTFILNEDLTTEDESNPSRISLYTRGSNADTSWSWLTSAISVNAATDEATFEGTTEFSQFIIGKVAEPKINLLKPQDFTLITANFNSIDLVYSSKPSFTDLDGDGLLDLITGENYGYLNHYEQDTVNSTSFILVIENFIDAGIDSAPSFTDLDGDGLLDMVIGEAVGNLNHYEQYATDTTSFSLVTENFNSIDIGSYSTPAFTDLDGDGLLDLIIGEQDGNLNHYEQDGVNSNLFSLITGNFNSIDVGDRSAPSFTDLDGDGLLDLIIGEYGGTLKHYEQDGVNSTSFSLITENFNSIDVGSRSGPAFTDLDGDGLLDMIIGEYVGNLNHYEQEIIDTLSFGNVFEGNNAYKNYYLKASVLISNLNIECPEGYKVSLSESAGFVQSLSITPVNQRIFDTIYLRFEPVSVKGYSGNIAHSSNGAETKNITVSGTGIESTPGTALDFDGTNDYVEVPDNSSLDLTDSLTIEAWIKADSWKANVWEGCIVNKEGNYSGFMLRCGDNGKVNFNIGTGAWNEVTTDEADSLSLNTWYHIAATYDGASQKIYINGVLVKEKPTSGDVVDNINSLMIGTSPAYLDRTFTGKIDEVRIWNIARDSVQIRENMHLNLDGTETGLVAYWQFNDGTGTTLSDVVGGNLGTLTNMDDSDWVTSTAPIPYFTVTNGNWESNSTWATGQNAPIYQWSRVKIKNNVTLNSSIEVIELKIENSAILTISTGNTLTVGGQ